MTAKGEAMSGGDPRDWLTKFLYPFSKSVRKHLNRGWQNQAGTSPPWTPQGKRYAQAEAERRALIASPPPLEGDARWMSLDETKAIAAQVVDQDRECDFLTMGYVPDEEKRELVPVVSPAPGHILTIAATRSGKGAAQIVPNLVTYAGSMLIIDPKGENYVMTHAWRRRFSRVFRIDPFRVTEGWDAEAAYSKFNPLAFVTDASAARRLANALLGEVPQGDNRFWHQEAANLLTGMLLHIIETSANPTLGQLRSLMGKTDEELQKILASGAQTTKQASVRSAFNRFIGHEERMRSGILAQVNANTGIWDEPAMSETVSDNHIDFAAMRGEFPVTVYVILPFDKLHSHSAFLKLIIALFYQSMIVPAPPPVIPTVCLIDEFPALGRMDELVKALGEITGYGVRFWLFAQGLNQLKSTYGKDWETILAQCATQSYFGITDNSTADQLSDQLGKRTIAYEIPHSNYGDAGMDADAFPLVNVSVSASLHFKGVPLASPNEIRRQFGVGRPLQVVFQSGYDPTMAALLPWYKVPDMQQVVTDLRTAKFNPPEKVHHDIPKRERHDPDAEVREAIEEMTKDKGIPNNHEFGVKDA